MVVHWAVQIFDVEATVFLTTSPCHPEDRIYGQYPRHKCTQKKERERERKQLDRWTDRYR